MVSLHSCAICSMTKSIVFMAQWRPLYSYLEVSEGWGFSQTSTKIGVLKWLVPLTLIQLLAGLPVKHFLNIWAKYSNTKVNYRWYFLAWHNVDFKGKHINGLLQNCSISIANALEILQSCTKSSIFSTQSIWLSMTWIFQLFTMADYITRDLSISI